MEVTFKVPLAPLTQTDPPSVLGAFTFLWKCRQVGDCKHLVDDGALCVFFKDGKKYEKLVQEGTFHRSFSMEEEGQ